MNETPFETNSINSLTATEQIARMGIMKCDMSGVSMMSKMSGGMANNVQGSYTDWQGGIKPDPDQSNYSGPKP